MYIQRYFVCRTCTEHSFLICNICVSWKTSHFLTIFAPHHLIRTLLHGCGRVCLRRPLSPFCLGIEILFGPDKCCLSWRRSRIDTRHLTHEAMTSAEPLLSLNPFLIFPLATDKETEKSPIVALRLFDLSCKCRPSVRVCVCCACALQN